MHLQVLALSELYEVTLGFAKELCRSEPFDSLLFTIPYYITPQLHTFFPIGN